MTRHAPRAAEDDPQPTGHFYDSEPIQAVKLRHPGRMLFAAILVVLMAAFIYDAAFNRPAFEWNIVGQYLFDTRIVSGVGYTILLTIYSMVIGIVLGIVLAVMRISPNPVVKSVSWAYLWFFRGTPIYVQLTFWGLFTTIYPTLGIGFPFLPPFFEFSTDMMMTAFVLAIIGLALNEAAYMAEIVRAGLLSVDVGQEEASIALGLGWWHTMNKVILPQAMRIIIPPTGNQVISMLKTTSLVNAVPFTLELFMRQKDIAAVTYKPVPMLLAASIWYLAITSILMIGQYYLERYYSKGHGARQEVMKPTLSTQTVTVVEGSGVTLRPPSASASPTPHDDPPHQEDEPR